MVRKLMPLTVALLAALLIQPAQAGPDDVEGTILLPTPPGGTGETGVIGDVECNPVDEPDTCHKGPFSGLHRRLYINAGEPSQGIFGYTIPITKRGVTFTLSPVPAGSADLDITFYKTLGDPPNGSPEDYPDGTKSFYGLFGTQPETGTVPPGTNYAIITSFDAVNVTFSYAS